MKMILLATTVFAAGPSFVSQGYSQLSAESAKQVATRNAGYECQSGRATRLSAWKIETVRHTRTVCTGSGIDRECDEVDMGPAYIALARFVCN